MQAVSKPKYVENMVEIPGDVQVSLNSPNTLTISGKLGQLTKSFINAGVEISMSDGSLKVRVYGRGRRAVAILNTVISVIKNMMTGVTSGFTYKMKIIQSHFPISVKIRGSELLIENFVGEKVPRKVKLPEGVKAAVKGDEIILTGLDKEKIGLAAGLIENATRVRDKDPRKYLDGIYLYEKKVGIET